MSFLSAIYSTIWGELLFVSILFVFRTTSKKVKKNENLQKNLRKLAFSQ